jgi:amidase
MNGFGVNNSTARARVEACLEIIDGNDARVRAWQYLDREVALTQAEARDSSSEKSHPLQGVPIGVKDIIDTADAPTECGSPIYAGHRPDADAACVTALREAGAVILGKTVTTEFATFKPPKTTNPHNAAHTPGGSSSGSAAAVACGMVPAALGSQTAGSVIRPAAFCGVVGFKPSYGAIDLAGVKVLAPGLDTLGTFARTVDQAALVARVIANPDGPLGKPDAGELPPPRIGLCRSGEWSQADPATHATLDAALKKFADAGAVTAAFDMPAPFSDLAAVQHELMTGEMAQALAWEHANHPDLLSPGLKAVLDDGAAYAAGRLEKAQDNARQIRDREDELFGDHDMLIAPSAAGEAPTAETTGDPVFNRAWTALHVPCINLPVASGRAGLPIGIQLIGRCGDDARLIAWARWAADVFSQ